MRWKRNLVQQEEMVDFAMEDKLGTTGRRDGGLCDGRETWYNRKRWWTVRWKRNLVQQEEMVDCAMEDKLGTTGRRDGRLCDGR